MEFFGSFGFAVKIFRFFGFLVPRSRFFGSFGSTGSSAFLVLRSSSFWQLKERNGNSEVGTSRGRSFISFSSSGETHQISSLLKEFEELKTLYQTDNELEINNNLESTPISQESDAYSSDEVSEDEDNEILTSAQIEKFRKIFDTIDGDDDEDEQKEQKKMEKLLNEQDEKAFKLVLQTSCCFALKEEVKACDINGGRLKKWANTRWHTMYDCVDSIMRHKVPLENVIF
ncbi:hypothetical protein RhiirC2_716991 [Rhizophagus irregularis]|uniref:Uncharacterized protein n=1 Tax=Rhizophagus irregularis TaxID=588596 RepID=A0A2N1MP55_9GLOM|nr:hypothetical protein RhiirC2_716991 [Rhizophagus irregularis]